MGSSISHLTKARGDLASRHSTRSNSNIDDQDETTANCSDTSFCTKTSVSDTTDANRLLREATPELRRHLTKKQVIVPHLQMFQMVDLHARNTPREIALTSDRLVTYLMSSCTNALNTVRIFYAWICLNVKCDNSKICQLVTSGFEPETVLRKRSTSPVGMNLLFYHFCRLVCIPCSLIHGVMKLGNHVTSKPAKMEATPNHAWVLILIQGQWRFVDCACGSGFGDEVKDERLTQEFFFLTDPEDLINSHFPLGLTNEVHSKGNPESLELKEALQMLTEPITFGQFYHRTTVSVLGMSIGLELLSHLDYQVNMEKAEQLSFRSTEITDLACVMTDRSTGSDCAHSILCTRTTKSEFRVVVKPPRCGSYALSVFAKVETWCGWPESFHRVVEYSLNVQKAEIMFVPFPEHFGVWGANSQAIQFGFSRRIFKFDVLSCRTGDLYVKLPITKFSRIKAAVRAASSDVLDSKESKDTQNILSTLTMQTEGVVHIRARFAETGFYAMSLLSQNRDTIHDAGTAFINVAEFLVNCRRRTRCFSPLPKSFPMSQHFRCLLEEPLHRNLVVNRSYYFRLVSPYLHVVKVDGEKMQVGRRRSRLASRTYYDEDDDGYDDGDAPDCGDNDRGVVWTLTFTPTAVGSPVYVYGCGDQVNNMGTKRSKTALNALFLFNVIADDDIDQDVDNGGYQSLDSLACR